MIPIFFSIIINCNNSSCSYSNRYSSFLLFEHYQSLVINCTKATACNQISIILPNHHIRTQISNNHINLTVSNYHINITVSNNQIYITVSNDQISIAVTHILNNITISQNHINITISNAHDIIVPITFYQAHRRATAIKEVIVIVSFYLYLFILI